MVDEPSQTDRRSDGAAPSAVGATESGPSDSEAPSDDTRRAGKRRRPGRRPLIVLVAIVVIAIMRLLGPKIGNTFSTINSSLP